MSTAQAKEAADELVAWADKRPELWQRDALRRISSSSSLAATDIDELYAILKSSAGFTISPAPPTPTSLTLAHLGIASSAAAVGIRGIKEIKGVNRLDTGAELKFSPTGLTVVYGPNGSGKTGYIRILRSACRTRITDERQIKILPNVYSSTASPTSAKIDLVGPSGNITVEWTDTAAASPLLLSASVFDSKAAELYVDDGNQIAFLPFGLSLPYRLNELCTTLKKKLESERVAVAAKHALTLGVFGTPRETKSQTFFNGITAGTSDEAIAAATSWSTVNEQRLAELNASLLGSTQQVEAKKVMQGWLIKKLAKAQETIEILDDNALTKSAALQEQAKSARAAAALSASDIFSAEPLKQVGDQVWRLMWQAARNYSTSAAYEGLEFPVTMKNGEDDARCVLCHQTLNADAAQRLRRFEEFVSGELECKAEAAEHNADVALEIISQLDCQFTPDDLAALQHVEAQFPKLASEIKAFFEAAAVRQAAFKDTLSISSVQPLTAIPAAEFEAAAQILLKEIGDLEAALSNDKRKELVAEQEELADQQTLALAKDTVTTKRDLLKEMALYDKAIKSTATTGITAKAGELVDKYLTDAVLSSFEAECKTLNIHNLKVSLQRKSGKTEANYQTKTASTITAPTSSILSEGEQRALALAAYFTEATYSAATGPLIIDDPVSSLDRERANNVAERIVEAAKSRQVVVFTHDLVFYNSLCSAAVAAGVSPTCCRIFSNTSGSGKIDPAGHAWKGMAVDARINIIDQDAKNAGKIHGTSPGEYEILVKNIYGRLRDTYERAVEEVLFCGVVTRYRDGIETKKLRYVDIPDALAIRFYDGMTNASTHSHDNPAAETVKVPEPDQLTKDIAELRALVNDFKAHQALTEKKRPSMKG